MQTAQREGWFGTKLATALDTQGMSVRGLARRLRPDDPESARRTLHRYLAGRTPSPEMRQQIATALGIDAGDLEPDSSDDEDEEDDRALRRIVGKLIERSEDDLARDLLRVVQSKRQRREVRA